MAKSSSYWDKRAIERMTDAEKYSEEYIKRIKRIYEQAFKNIDAEIERVYNNYSKDTGLDVQKLKELLTYKETSKMWKTLKRQGLDKYIKQNYKSRISRLEQIQAQIYAKAKLIYDKEELENTMCYKGVVNNTYYKAVYDTQMGTGYDFSFSKLDNNTLNTLLNEKWSGKNYSQRIWTNTDILANSLSEIVGGALIIGQGIEKTAKQIRDRFNVSKYYAERLVRTETNYFHGQADLMAYEDMGVDKYVFVAVLDNRTSLICQELDGKVFKTKDAQVGVNLNPMHPNCRSTTRGYLGKEEEEQLLERNARNPITGKTEKIKNMTYKEWYNKNVAQYGKSEIDKSYKMVKNKANDKKQYDNYKKYLGKDVKSFENFKEIKYNDKEKWENIKSYVDVSRKGNMPLELNFNKYNDNLNGVNWEAVNFSPKLVSEHFEKHKNEFGNIDIETYKNNAKLLSNSEIKDNILGFTNDNGFVFRYDKEKNEFTTTKPSGIIETYFKPKKGYEYWEVQVNKYGNKKDV